MIFNAATVFEAKANHARRCKDLYLQLQANEPKILKKRSRDELIFLKLS